MYPRLLNQQQRPNLGVLGPLGLIKNMPLSFTVWSRCYFWDGFHVRTYWRRRHLVNGKQGSWLPLFLRPSQIWRYFCEKCLPVYLRLVPMVLLETQLQENYSSYIITGLGCDLRRQVIRWGSVPSYLLSWILYTVLMFNSSRCLCSQTCHSWP